LASTESRAPAAPDRVQRAWEEARRQYERARAQWKWGGFFRWFGIAFGGGIIVLLVVLITLDWNTMRGPISRFASTRLGREVQINGNLRVHLFTWEPWLTAESVTVANPDWLPESRMGRVDRITIRTRWIPILFGRTIFPLVQADRPDVSLVRDESGAANWNFSGNPDADTVLDLPPITRLIVNDGHLTLNDAKNRLVFEGAFSSHEEVGGKRADRFVLDGRGTLRGLPLTASVRGGPLVHVDADKPYAISVDLRHAGTHVVADGALARPFTLGNFTAKARLSGPSIADLYFLTGVAMPNTAPYHLSGTFSRDAHFYRFANFGGTVGKSDLFGEIDADTASGRPKLKASLESRSLAFSDLGPLIGSKPGEGTEMRMKTAGGATRIVMSTARVLPDLPLRVERVRGTDAVVDYKADAIRSQDFPLRQLRLHFELDHGVMHFNPLSFTFPQGRLSGTAKIDARGKVPVSDIDARIVDVQLAQFFGSAHPLIEGTMEARARLHGQGDSIHKAASTASGTLTIVVPRGTVRKAYAELSGIDVTPGLFELLGKDRSDTGLRCAVAHFEARGGSLFSEQLLIDTDPVQITGHGTVNLETERINFSIRGHPKSFKLIRLRAPILIGGTLADPDVHIQAGSAIAQGGLAVALGAFLSPLAAILPFVDPGLAKDANCAALLGSAKAEGAPVKSKSIITALPTRK
jgi:uncharacterized protein involved in outer membrane biogenesis